MTSLVQPFGFVGQLGYHTDPSGVVQVGIRSYLPEVGRWTQPDPTRQDANLYLYAAGDPTNLVDPTGAVPWSCIGSAFSPLSPIPTSTSEAAIQGGVEIASAGSGALAYAGATGASIAAASAAGVPLIAAGVFLVGYGISRC